jgi:hypothetical protein
MSSNILHTVFEALNDSLKDTSNDACKDFIRSLDDNSHTILQSCDNPEYILKVYSIYMDKLRICRPTCHIKNFYLIQLILTASRIFVRFYYMDDATKTYILLCEKHIFDEVNPDREHVSASSVVQRARKFRNQLLAADSLPSPSSSIQLFSVTPDLNLDM